MSDPSKKPLARKDSSDSTDEAAAQKDEGSSARVCPIIEEPPATEVSASSPAQTSSPAPTVDSASGEGTSSGASGAVRPTCLSPDWNPEDSADSSKGACGTTKVSPKKSPIKQIYDSVKGLWRKISPKKKSPKKKSPPKPMKPPRPGFESETRDIQCLPRSSSGFQPYYKYNYDAKSIKSVEETDYTETGDPASAADVTSMPTDSLPTSPLPMSPLSKDLDSEEGTPKKVMKFDYNTDDKEKSG